MKISVILPVLNEEKEIEQAIASVRQNFSGELLVVDGGSTDATVEKVLRLENRVLHGPRGLAAQCNYGAEQATGEILFFLGADVRLPSDWESQIKAALQSPYVAGGGFSLFITGKSFFYSVISFGGNWRARTARFSNPDQGLFLRRHDWEKAGGFDSASRIPFAKLSRFLSAQGEFRFLRPVVLSSPRKWETHGRFRTTFHHLKTYLAYRWFE